MQWSELNKERKVIKLSLKRLKAGLNKIIQGELQERKLHHKLDEEELVKLSETLLKPWYVRHVHTMHRRLVWLTFYKSLSLKMNLVSFRVKVIRSFIFFLLWECIWFFLSFEGNFVHRYKMTRNVMSVVAMQLPIYFLTWLSLRKYWSKTKSKLF